MKVLVTVDPEIPVPPIYYGGIERIVNSLVIRYQEIGHQIILVANPASDCRGAEKIVGWQGLNSRSKTDILKNSRQLLKVAKKFKPDIIHSFSRLLYLYPIFLTTKIPVVQTYQRAINPISTGLASRVASKQLTFTACGAHLFRSLPEQDKWHAIHNFTDTDYLVPAPETKKEHLLFLGRIEEIKGTKEAIEVALKANEKLVIAGNIPAQHQTYFDREIKPHLKHPNIEYVGPVDNQQKRFYFQRAKAFLFPIKWEEPFGIVMAESLACGTPVIGFKRGSVPEVIDHGKNGFSCQNSEEMVIAINQIDKIDRTICRKSALENFSASVISSKYLELFEQQLT